MTRNIPLEDRDKLFAELNHLISHYVGENKYALILAYEYDELRDKKTGHDETGMMYHALTNLDLRSQVLSWKGILTYFAEKVNEMFDQYNIKIGQR